MNDENVWQLVGDCLREDIPVILLIIVQSHGSTPGRIGFKMAVAADGQSAGTIGGVVEHEFFLRILAASASIISVALRGEGEVDLVSGFANWLFDSDADWFALAKPDRMDNPRRASPARGSALAGFSPRCGAVWRGYAPVSG